MRIGQVSLPLWTSLFSSVKWDWSSLGWGLNENVCKVCFWNCIQHNRCSGKGLLYVWKKQKQKTLTLKPGTWPAFAASWITSLLLTLLAGENAVIWEVGILTFSLGYLGKYFIRGSRRISSRSQCSFGTIRSPAALVRQCQEQEESV